jgi:hypothetical protein
MRDRRIAIVIFLADSRKFGLNGAISDVRNPRDPIY